MQVKLTQEEVKNLAYHRALRSVWKTYAITGVISFVILFSSLATHGVPSVVISSIGIVGVILTHILFYINASSHERKELEKLNKEIEEKENWKSLKTKEK